LQSELKKDHGLARSTLYQDVANPCIFQFISEWNTDQRYEEYLSSEHFRILIGALKVLSEEAEIRYHIGPQEKGKKILES